MNSRTHRRFPHARCPRGTATGSRPVRDGGIVPRPRPRLPLVCGLALSMGFVAALSPGEPALAGDRDESLERCRYLHKRIAHYTRLRRSGGSTAQMERWRRQRQGYETEYRERRCYRFGGRLTLDR